MSAQAFADQTLGIEGASGISAIRGSDGQSGSDAILDVTGAVERFDLRGQDGEDASGRATNGNPAWNCQQLNVGSNLMGASGGAGGNGASGGRGGEGGTAYLYIPNLSKLSLLKNLTILNSGGAPGADSPEVGEGGPPCRCAYSGWEETDPYTGQVLYFKCEDGLFGSRGTFNGSAGPSYYGWVNILVGVDSKTKISPTFGSKISAVLNQTYILNGFISEIKTGLKSLLSVGSKTANEYRLRTYFQRKVKIEWKAKVSPEEAKMQNASVGAQILGPVDKATVAVTLPNNLRRQIVETPDTTLVTITHVLNSSDPVKIANCAKHDGKGSNLCELSDSCFYEAGYCLPK